MTNRIRRREQQRGKLIAAPPTTVEPSPEQMRPLFGLQHLPRTCLTQCTKDDQAAFADTLSKLSQLTWAQIRAINRHKLGFETIPQDELSIGTLPVSKEVRILVFRFSGMKAMIGYRDRATFFPLWLDIDFSAYKHN